MPSSSLSDSIAHRVDLAIAEHKLPNSFKKIVANFYWPIAEWLQLSADEKWPKIIGIQGSQGSGKSTSAAFLKLLLEQQYALKVSVVSLDDYYLTQAERSSLADQIHPLLKTRGVPGTHDVSLILKTFSALRSGKAISVPRFNKANDERMADSDWHQIEADTDVLIFEGWCVGITAQDHEDLLRPANALEHDEDKNHQWRSFVNRQLESDYADIFAQLDFLIAVQAPSFDCVFEWRMLQEEKMIARLKEAGEDISNTLNAAQIERFISHYQRLTEHAFDIMPSHADCVLYLNSDHSCRELVFPKLKT